MRKTRGINKPGLLDNSILVVAHPDDEILWFSSIAEQVKEIIIAFQDVPSRPDWSKGRAESIQEHPLDTVSSLCITESEAFHGANWENPVLTNYGLEIVYKKSSELNYQNNYTSLKHILRSKLASAKNVITHNPWGEYGHEEHVQVYRAVKTLQKELDFDLWFSNYCSNWSVRLMSALTTNLNHDYLLLETNPTLASCIMEIYKKHNCWTWLEDIRWFEYECLIHDTTDGTTPGCIGYRFPLNYIVLNSKKSQKVINNPVWQSTRNILGRIKKTIKF